jgi:two-component system, cell cycle sensor histidine kinase and response regulator CckA
MMPEAIRYLAQTLLSVSISFLLFEMSRKLPLRDFLRNWSWYWAVQSFMVATGTLAVIWSAAPPFGPLYFWTATLSAALQPALMATSALALLPGRYTPRNRVALTSLVFAAGAALLAFAPAGGVIASMPAPYLAPRSILIAATTMFLTAVFTADRDRLSSSGAKMAIIASVLFVAHHAASALGDYRLVPGLIEYAEQSNPVGMLLIIGMAMGIIATSIQVAHERDIEVLEAERRYKSMLEELPLAGLMLDRDGRVTFANRHIAAMLGATPEALLGADWQSLAAAHGQTAGEREVDASLLAGRTQTAQVDGLLLDHQLRERSFHWTKTVLKDKTGRISGIASIGLDVTEQRELEQQIRQFQKMEGIGQLAGGVAHDFNNHLTVIGGYCDLLLTRLASDAFATRALSAVHKASSDAAALVRQLLAFSRRQLLELQPANLRVLIEEFLEVLRPLVREEIALEAKLDPASGNILADSVQIRQIIMNLVANSADSITGPGRILIETSNCCLDLDYAAQHPDLLPGDYVLLTVSDTGCGFDQATRAHIFEPFFTTKPSGQGTGLGLATVYGIVRQSQGWIWVYSEPGHGTTFKIYFPRIDAPAEQKAPQPTEASDSASTTILLVEDRDDVREFIASALQHGGHEVLTASSGADALNLAPSDLQRVQLLVTDVIMPGMNGKELAKRFCALVPNLRVLLISGYTSNVIVRDGVLEPGVEHLAKPFTAEQLLGRVRSIMA